MEVVMTKRVTVACAFVGVLTLGWVAALTAQRGTQPPPANPNRQQVVQMMKDISNWGRWGKDDELGTFNLITPQKRLQAVRLVREGISVSLAHTLDKEVMVDNPTPFKQEFFMGPDG